MRNIKITYSYDGSDFFGFQRQPDKRTVQGEIEKVLKIILKSDINMVTAGRTDRGVHANVQVSNFYIDENITIPLKNFQRALNKLLPNDIDIYKIEEVDLDFNSRFQAKRRAYEYIITWKKDVFSRRYKTYVGKEIDCNKFLEILNPLIGEHDFNNFRLKDENNKTSIREIYKIETYLKDKNTMGIYIEGNAFLKTQIRIIVGTALDIYFGRKPENYIRLLLENPNEERKIEIAEPSGLYLTKVEY
ncbi:tRNA pseudouridine(38-40) synthase TruA [Fusobacterium sp.]|uniref:tRNA pseudouridine(38-40) synthase TruA n=1 Tax=Fusobacterium sp. TaxID=68766 RepID=UPI0026149B66|nr:tRNA pseudouridine(38-40) synthase TruA [Fusobacterium sp.]